MKINIGIDGPVASGKSTIAKKVAQQLGYIHIDTGAMYRCVAYMAMQAKVDIHNEAQVSALLPSLHIKLHSNGSIECNGRDITSQIRSHEVSNAASVVAAFSSVRKNLVIQQQKMAQEKGYVMDGRDINTVVLPDSECQIYLTASIESRAARRYLDLQARGQDVNLDIIKHDIQTRDYNDMNRLDSPLKVSQNAHVIDTSHMSIEEVVTQIVTLAKEVHND
ncbi:MAG: (d)CMP kinase [Erysipelotrichia bacterium]|jgi:cytidylate kinase|nr:(d)CMP kinase [Erysipelotrichia bacterium]